MSFESALQPVDMFGYQTKINNDLQKLKQEFHDELDGKINKFKNTIDMEYFIGVEFQRELTCDFMENLKGSTKESSPNDKNILGEILVKTSNYANELKSCVDKTYKDKEIDLLKNLNGLLSKYQETKDVVVLSPLYRKQSGGYGNGPTQIDNYVQPQINQENRSQTNSQQQNNPFIALSYIFKSSDVTNDILEQYVNYKDQVLNICDNQFKYIESKLNIIDDYINDVFNSDVGSLFYLMTQLIHYKLDLTDVQTGGRRKRRVQYGSGKISDFIRGTAKKYDDLPLSKKLFYVEHISIDLLGFMLNKFLVLVGLFEIDITKISNPYDFLKEIEGFVNNVLFTKIDNCIRRSEEKDKKLSGLIQETKSWIKISLNIHRMLGLISLILSYVPEGSKYITDIKKLEVSINSEKEVLGSVKKTLLNKTKLLQQLLSNNGDMLLSDMIQNKDMQKILTMSVFKTKDEQDVNFDIKCILKQSYTNISTLFSTYADALKDVHFDNSAKMKVLTIFQKIGHSYNGRVIRNLFNGLTKGLTKMNKFIDKAQSRILSKLLIGTQAVFLNAMFMYGPLMVNGMLLVLWGCTKGCMLMHKYRKQRQQVQPVNVEVWNQMVIDENDKTNLIDKIKKLVGDNSELLGQLDIEDSIKNIPKYIEEDVHLSFLKDVKDHDFSVIVDNYTQEGFEELNEYIYEITNELPDPNDMSKSSVEVADKRMNTCDVLSQQVDIKIRIESVTNDQMRNEIDDIYKDEEIIRHCSTTNNDNDIASIFAATHARKIAAAWVKKTNNAKIYENNSYDDSKSKEMQEIIKDNDVYLLQSLERKPSICTPRLSSLLRNRSSILSRAVANSARTISVTSNIRQPSVLVPSSLSGSMPRKQKDSENIAKLTELITLRSVVNFKTFQSGGKSRRYSQQQKQSMFVFLNKYNKLQLQQYALNKKINVKNLTSKKDIISQIMKYRANRKI
jgi:hypothetical protein